MGPMASQITSLTIVYSTVYSGADQRKRQSSASLAFVWGIHQWPVNSPQKCTVTLKMFPFDDVIMWSWLRGSYCNNKTYGHRWSMGLSRVQNESRCSICAAPGRPFSQISQCIRIYPTMHHFVTAMCTFLLQNGVLWDVGLVHCGICATGLLEGFWGHRYRAGAVGMGFICTDIFVIQITKYTMHNWWEMKVVGGTPENENNPSCSTFNTRIFIYEYIS